MYYFVASVSIAWSYFFFNLINSEVKEQHNLSFLIFVALGWGATNGIAVVVVVII
jgi:hypothetical protein